MEGAVPVAIAAGSVMLAAGWAEANYPANRRTWAWWLLAFALMWVHRHLPAALLVAAYVAVRAAFLPEGVVRGRRDYLLAAGAHLGLALFALGLVWSTISGDYLLAFRWFLLAGLISLVGYGVDKRTDTNARLQGWTRRGPSSLIAFARGAVMALAAWMAFS